MADIFRISLAAARVNANMTQKEVAKELHVAPNTVCAWEVGKAMPSYSTLRTLAEIYGVPFDNLILAKNLS